MWEKREFCLCTSTLTVLKETIEKLQNGRFQGIKNPRAWGFFIVNGGVFGLIYRTNLKTASI